MSCSVETDCGLGILSDLQVIIADFKVRSSLCLYVCLFFSTREHDKNPDLFFEALKVLVDEGQKFFISVVGETFDTSPGEFSSRSLLVVEMCSCSCELCYSIR